jgi:Predicted membrane protein
MSIYLPILTKLAIGLVALIIQINVMGKGNLAPTNALDQVQNYVLGGIIGAVIYSDTITVFQFTIVLIIWTMLVMTFKFLKEHNRYVKLLIDGQPKVVIERGKVNIKNVLSSGLSANDLMFKLRSQSVYDLSQVKRAVLEINGQLTVILAGEENMKYPIVFDGQINMDVLDIIDRDESWLTDIVQNQGYDSINDIFVGEYIDGKVRLTPYESK